MRRGEVRRGGERRRVWVEIYLTYGGEFFCSTKDKYKVRASHSLVVADL